MKWFRSYHRAPFDPKWLTVALRAKCRVAEVVCVWWALMDHASQQEDRGSIEGFDAEEAAAFFQIDQTAIEAVMVALQDKGCTNGKRIVNWESYQPDETSTKRVKEHRERSRNGDETVCNGEETKCNEISSISKSPSESELAQKLFDEWYALYPRKQGRGNALRAFRTALKKITFPELVAGVERYKRMKPDYADWAMPATWLNGERWLDKPSEPQKAAAAPAVDHYAASVSRLKNYRPGKFWSPMWGSRPEDGGEDLHPKALAEWRAQRGSAA